MVTPDTDTPSWTLPSLTKYTKDIDGLGGEGCGSRPSDGLGVSLGQPNRTCRERGGGDIGLWGGGGVKEVV